MTMNYYDICCKCRGKVVTITDREGRVHCGRIVDVDERYVYLERRQRTTALGGYGYGYYGGYYGGYGYPGYAAPAAAPAYGHGHGGWGHGSIFPVALAAIGGFALGTAFFW